MAKAWPKIPGKRPGQQDNRPPNQGMPRPPARNETYKQIGELIVSAWEAAVRDTDKIPLDREHLQAEISKHLELDDDPNGKVEIGVILDPKPDQGRKFIWIVIPYPDAPKDINEKDWVEVYANSDDLKTRLGEAVLFGCGR